MGQLAFGHATAIVIERCLSAANSSCGNDGGGYGLDGDCIDCVVQNCASVGQYFLQAAIQGLQLHKMNHEI